MSQNKVNDLFSSPVVTPNTCSAFCEHRPVWKLVWCFISKREYAQKHELPFLLLVFSIQFNSAPCLTFYFRYPCRVLLLWDKNMLFGKNKCFSSYVFRNKGIICSFVKNIFSWTKCIISQEALELKKQLCDSLVYLSWQIRQGSIFGQITAFLGIFP